MFRKYLFNFCSAQSNKALNHYEILELKPGCTAREIKQNYLKLAKIYHPDVYKGRDSDRFRQIQEAYQILKSKEKRIKYDESMKIRKDINDSGFQNEKQDNDDEDNKTEFQMNPNTFQFRDYQSKNEGTRPEDFQEEFDRFMSREMKTDPGKIVMYENPFMRQLNQEYKDQQEFVRGRKLNWHSRKVKQERLGYKQQVDFYIQSVNTYVEQMKKRKENVEELKKKYKRQLRWGYILIGSLFMFCVPFVQSALERRAKVRRWIEEDKRRFEEMEKEALIEDTQQRFVY